MRGFFKVVLSGRAAAQFQRSAFFGKIQPVTKTTLAVFSLMKVLFGGFVNESLFGGLLYEIARGNFLFSVFVFSFFRLLL